MTKNKKKLRRVERRYSVTKSAQTLVLAGMLLAGGVTGAMAADIPAVVDITEDITQTVTVLFKEQFNIKEGKHLTVNGGSYVYATGMVVDGNNHFTIEKTGKLTLTNNENAIGSVQAYYSHLNAGSETTITGTNNANWDKAAQLAGYFGMDISGKLTLNENSMVYVGVRKSGTLVKMEIKNGADITLNGTAYDTNKWGGNAAHIWAGNPGKSESALAQNKLTIEDGAKISVPSTKYGVISSQFTEMTGGQIDVTGGKLLIQHATGEKHSVDAENGSLVYKGVGTYPNLKPGKFDLSGGIITVGDVDSNEGGLVFNDYLTLNITGNGTLNTTTLTVKEGGAPTGEAPDGTHAKNLTTSALYLATDYATSTTKGINSKTATVGAKGSLHVTGDAIVGNGGALTISGANSNMTVDGNLNILGTTATATGDTPGRVTVGANGSLFVAKNLDGTYGILDIADNADTNVTVLGTYSTLGKKEDSGSHADRNSLSYAGAAKVTMGALNIPLRDSGDTTKPAFNVTGAGPVTFLGLAGGTASIFNGNKITVSGSGVLHLGAIKESSLTSHGGTYTGDVKVSGGALKVNAKDWTVNGALKQTNTSAITIAGGNLTVNKFSQATAGTTTIGGTDGAGILKVTGNAATDFVHSVASGVTVDSAGALDAQASALGTLAGNAFTIAGSNEKFIVNSNGTLVLRWTAGTELNSTALNAIKTALLTSGSTGIIKHEGAKLNITADGAGSLNGTVTDSTASNAGNTLLDTSVGVAATGGSADVNGGYGTPHLTVDLGSSTSGTLTVKNDTTLTGAGGSLVDVKGSSTAKAEDVNFTLDGGSSLNLGNVTEAAGSGTIGNVTLGTGKLNATNGDFTVGDVTGASATLQATGSTAGTTTLNTGKIDVATIESGAHATINATDTVKVNDVALSGGTLQALESGKATITIGSGGSLTLTNGATVKAGDTLTIKDVNGTSITIDGGNLVAGTTIDATGKDLVVAAGGLSVQATDGTVKVKDINGDLGKTIVVAKTLTSTGTVTLKGSESVMTLTGTGTAASSIDGLSLSNSAAASAGDLTLTDTNNTGTAATIGNGSNLDVTGTLTTNRDIVVGSATSGEAGATVSIAKLDLKGKGLFVDPAWGQQSANVAVGSFTTTATPADVKINGDIGVGMNSLLAVGTTDKTWLAGKVAEMGGLSQNGIGAALGLKTAQVIDSRYGLPVNGTKTNADFTGGSAPTANTANFAKDSLLIVSSDAATSAAGALNFSTTGGTAVIQDGAKLRIADAKVNQKYTVLGTNITTTTYTDAAGNTITTGGHTGWTGSNLSTDSNMVLLNQNADGTFGTTMASATGTFHGMSDQMGKIVEKMYGSNLHNPHSSNAGIRFASRATMPDYLSAEQAAATIEGAAQLAVVGAAPAMTLSAVQAGTSTVTTRTSFASPLLDSSKAVALHKDVDGTLSVDSGLNAGNGMKNGFGLWIMPLYQSNSAWGMKADGFKGGYKSDLGGVALGADYTFNDMFRLGLAFNIGGGYAESNGDFNKTENSFNFWGINAYGGWTMNNFGITADVGYTGNYNKLQQELPSGMGMSDIKSDVNSSAWTAGLRGEYKFATEALDIIPHVGVRYTGLTTDEYKAKSGGDTVFKVDQDFQSIWTFPIGVTLAKEIETGSGWIIRPQVDLGITPATGDVKAKSKVRIPGVDAQAEMKMQVVDYMSYDGGVGLEMKKDNVSFGINYNIQASEHRTGHGVFGTFRYEF